MIINRIKDREVEILDFEQEIGIEIIVNERSKRDFPNLKRFYCSFKGVDIKQGCFLCGLCGDGDTIDECLKDYCNQISACLMISSPAHYFRKEIEVPNLIHTRLLGE